jgi:biopolymer transport protein ExbD
MMDVNTTPLIDVMLVLLVMLIITIPIQLHAVNLELPVARPASAVPKVDKIQIDIDADGRLYWQGTAVGAEEMRPRMQSLATMPVAPELHVRPHKDSSYAVFAAVLAESRRAGLTKVAVIGSEQFVR